MTTLPDANRERAATMKEVAALAGVSLKTVSRVVNHEPGVSQELIERVQHAVRLLEYNHNSAASNLRRTDQRTSTIGVLLDDVSNPFSSVLHRAIEDVARQHHTLVFATSSDENADREREVVLNLASRRIDGLIVVQASQEQHSLEYLRRLRRPIVSIDRPSMLRNADSVVVDNRGGASMAVRHLAEHGHRQIAFLGDASALWTASERHLGYLEGLAAEGLRLDRQLVQQDIRSMEQAEAITRTLLALPEPPTAFFAGQNLITIGVVRALQQAGRHLDTALVGFDDFLLADLLHPPVTVISQEPARLGRTAAELLFARLNGDKSPPRFVVLPTQLIARGSGEIQARSSVSA